MKKQLTSSFRTTFINIGICLLLAACSGGGGGDGDLLPCQQFDCKGMLSNLANNIMMPAITQFSTDASAMSIAVEGYFTAQGTGADEITKRDAARLAWKTAMTSLQAVEMMQMGPLTDNIGALRDTIYSWPDTNTCKVDQDVVLADAGTLSGGTTAYDLTQRPLRRRGMDALEYVLFNDNLDHSCIPPTVPVDPVGATTWNTRPAAERRAARAKYAKLAAADVANQAQTLLNKWNGTDGNFLVELTQPGTGASRFTNVEEAVNVVSDALFYFEDETKDRKLAEPIGVQNLKTDNACFTRNEGCGKAVESPFSLTSKENIKTNLLTLQELFLGNKPGAASALLGFDDFLDKMGEANASAPIRDGIANAILALDLIPGDLKTAVGTPTVPGDYATVKAAWAAAKVITDQLKLNFVDILGLSIPASAANDGD